jgi:hypothetical protein
MSETVAQHVRTRAAAAPPAYANGLKAKINFPDSDMVMGRHPKTSGPSAG